MFKGVDKLSVASEITRIQNAKADIKTAIEGKGVTVPSATKIDGYADLIDDIPTGGSPTGTKNISITSNGTTTEDVASYASAQITTNVPNSYSVSDEGKVVDNGALVSQTSDTVTANDTYDTTLINSLTVNVSGGGGSSVSPIIVFGGANVFKIPAELSNGLIQPVYSLPTTRISVWETSGEHPAYYYVGNGLTHTWDEVKETTLYPISIPSGKSTLSVSASTASQQLICFFIHWNTNQWVIDLNSGWVNLSGNNFSIPAESTHFVLMFRISSANSNYQNQSYSYLVTSVDLLFA